MGLAIRFFGSVFCGIVLGTCVVGAAALFHCYDPADTWVDVGDDLIKCGLIGAIAGTTVGTLWGSFECIRRLFRRARGRERL